MSVTVGRMFFFESVLHGRVLYEVLEADLPCTRCGGNDGVVMSVMANDRVGLDQVDGYFLPNDRKGTKLRGCAAEIQRELRTKSEVFRQVALSQESKVRQWASEDRSDLNAP